MFKRPLNFVIVTVSKVWKSFHLVSCHLEKTGVKHECMFFFTLLIVPGAEMVESKPLLM